MAVVTLLRHPSRLRHVPGAPADPVVDRMDVESARRPERPALELRFIGHATVLLEVAGVRVLTDPFLRGRPWVRSNGTVRCLTRRRSATSTSCSSRTAHPDHFDPRSLRLPPRPSHGRRAARARPRRRVDGSTATWWSCRRRSASGSAESTVEAVPARHWISPGAPRAQPLGYLIDGGPRVYFAGDTGRFDALSQLAGRVDVALLPVWTWGPHLGPGHLGPRSAAEVLALIGPPVAIPIHWGTLYPRRLHRIWGAPLAEPGDRFAAHAGRVAPRSQVRVLRPGESTWVGDVDRAPD